MLGDRLRVGPLLDSRRGLDQLPRDGQPDDALVVVCVDERVRNRMALLAQQPVLDDHVLAPDFCDAAGVAAVARDHFVSFHAPSPTHPGPPLTGNEPAWMLVSASKPAVARVAEMGETTPEAEPRKLAEEARDRARFEEEALDLADQAYRGARRLVASRPEAEDWMQEPYARACRAWHSYTPEPK